MICLLRHGAIQDAKGRFIGTTDLPLTPEGKEQARELARGLVGFGLKALYASPLRRTLDTAAPPARACGLTVIQIPELAEIHLGEWEGRDIGEIKREQPEAYAARGRDFAGFRPPGGESFTDLAERSMRGLEKLAAGPRPCAAVTHSGVIRVVLCRVLGLDLNDLFRFEPQPANAFLLEKDHNGWRVLDTDVPPHELAGFRP